MSDESFSDAESLFNGSESELEDSYDENLFESEQKYKVNNHISSNLSVPLRVCDDARSHDFFEEDVECSGGDGGSSYRK